jgi:regulator of replication initiation timing
MKSKPIKSTNPKPETVITLQQKIIKLQIQIDGLKNKVLKLENKTLKQEQKIIKLQTENEKLIQPKEITPLVLNPVVEKMVNEYLERIKNPTHNKSPEK